MSSRILTAALLASLCACLSPLKTAAQCEFSCSANVVVPVPANGSVELSPALVLAADPGQSCPGGLQLQVELNGNFVPTMGNFVLTPAHIGQSLVYRVRHLGTTQSCTGTVQVVAQMTNLSFHLCTEFWKNGQPIKGATLTLQPQNPAFPYAPLTFELDSTQSCAEVNLDLGDYLPGTTFGYWAAQPNEDFANGVNVADFCRMREHLLGIDPLPTPYAILAGDVNRSFSLTTLDIVEAWKVLLGTYPDGFPNNTSWRFFGDYCEFPNPSNPFNGNCDFYSTSELMALNGDTAKIIGMKIGDVDGSAALPGQVPPALEGVSMVLPSATLQAGVPVAIPVRFSQDLDILSWQAFFQINPDLAHFDSVSSPIFSFSSPVNLYYEAQTGKLGMVQMLASVAEMPAQTPAFFIHLRPTQTVEIEDIIQIQMGSTAPKNLVMDGECGNLLAVEAAYFGSVATHSPLQKGLRVQSPSPNPFSERAFLEIELETTETTLLEVTDLMGRVLFSEEKNLSSGTHRWEIPASAIPLGGLGIWRVRIGGEIVSGKLARQ